MNLLGSQMTLLDASFCRQIGLRFAYITDQKQKTISNKHDYMQCVLIKRSLCYKRATEQPAYLD